MDARRQVGRDGEEVAVEFLTGLGWTILDRNWRHGRLGELDLVALEPAPDGSATVVFCEVKTRRGLGFGDPLEALTAAKLARLRRLALAWLAQHERSARRIRIDALGVLCLPGQPPQIRHARAVAA
ncbi:MAG: YraN family protein [Propionibacteriaceae bacterium]|jgi:putative endonuclease|nr:YraN family protein [Propionibacteriaceae bacterium]